MRLEKHTDGRGWLVEVLREDAIKEGMRQIYLTVSKRGAVRGNHYHIRKTEWFCVVRGEAKLVLKNNKSGQRKTLVLSGDEPQTVSIPPNIVHAIQNTGDDDMYMIAITNETFNPNDPDTFRDPII